MSPLLALPRLQHTERGGRVAAAAERLRQIHDGRLALQYQPLFACALPCVRCVRVGWPPKFIRLLFAQRKRTLSSLEHPVWFSAEVRAKFSAQSISPLSK